MRTPGGRRQRQQDSNMLTRGTEIVAVLDFDEVALDYCISDLAYAFVYLGTRFTNWKPTPASVREALLQGPHGVHANPSGAT